MFQTGERTWDAEKDSTASPVSEHCVHCWGYHKSAITWNNKEPHWETLHPTENKFMHLSKTLRKTVTDQTF